MSVPPTQADIIWSRVDWMIKMYYYLKKNNIPFTKWAKFKKRLKK